MRKSFSHHRYIIFFIWVAWMIIAGCRSADENIPLPENETEFSQPVAQSLKFTEPKKVKWTTTPADSIKSPIVKKVNFDKLPVQPNALVDFKPLLKRLEEIKVDLNSLPDTTIALNKFPINKIQPVNALFGPPKRVKAGTPNIKDEAMEGILIFGQDEGLPSPEVMSMLQDKQGILWIGSDNGLSRFDGEHVDLFTMNEGLSSNFISSLLEDKKGRIWIGTGNGVDIYDPRNGVIGSISDKQGLPKTVARTMVEDDDGNVWIGFYGGGIAIYNADANTLKFFGTQQGLSHDVVWRMIKDKNGNIWIGTRRSGVDIYNPKEGTLRHLNSGHGLSSDKISSLFEDSHGNILIGTNGAGLNMYDPQNGTLKKMNTTNGLANDIVMCMTEDRNGHLLIGNFGNGMNIYDPENGLLKQISSNEGLSDNSSMSILKEKNGSIWLGTYGGGINIYNTDAGTLRYFMLHPEFKPDTKDLIEDRNGNIWIATEGQGVSFYNQKTRVLKSLDMQQLQADPHSYSLLEDHKGNIWISTSAGELLAYDPQTATVKLYGKDQGLTGRDIQSLLEDEDGMIWVASRSGVNILDPQNGSVKHLGQDEGLPDNYVLVLRKSINGNIWIGTSGGGVSIYNTKDATIKQLHSPGGTINHWNDLNVTDLAEDKNGMIWFAASAKGIFIIDEKKSIIYNISVAEGLADLTALSFKEKKGQMFVGTGKGLSVVKSPDSATDKWSVKSYGKLQQLAKLDFNNHAALLTKTGELWWGIDNTLTIMTNEPLVDSTVRTTNITGIDIDDQPQYFDNNKQASLLMKTGDTLWNPARDTFYMKDYMPGDSGYLRKNHVAWDSIATQWNIPVNLVLPWNQNHLNFHFTGAHLSDQDKTRYRFILEGSDKIWSPITSNAFAEYRNLSAGKYTFRVSSLGFNGRWSAPAAFSFSIRPPWWLSDWAWLLYILTFGWLVWSFIQFRSRKLIKEKHVLEQKVNTRTAEVLQQKEEIAAQRDNLEKTLDELKSAQKQLIHSEKMASLGELTAGIAHEIQNPLNFVNNFSEVNTELIDEMKNELLSGNKDEAISIANNIKDNEEKINLHGKRAGAIVKSMLQHSQNNAGQKELTDINALADEYLRLSYNGVRANDKSFTATLKKDFDEQIGKINIIPQDMGRVLLNLFNNAFYAVKEKSKLAGENYEPIVSTATRKLSGKLEIRIRDNGMGISQKLIDKIFQPFFTTKPAGKGTGLGLSLSYDIVVKEHGGTIKVESREGEYTEFIIELNN